MRNAKKHEAFINLCRAARELRDSIGADLYRDEIKTILAPFNRVGRSIGLSHVRGKDMEAATAALRQRTACAARAEQMVEALIGQANADAERLLVESWCKKNGYALVPVEEWRKCSDLQLSKLLDEMFASSLDKPKSLG